MMFYYVNIIFLVCYFQMPVATNISWIYNFINDISDLFYFIQMYTLNCSKVKKEMRDNKEYENYDLFSMNLLSYLWINIFHCQHNNWDIDTIGYVSKWYIYFLSVHCSTGAHWKNIIHVKLHIACTLLALQIHHRYTNKLIISRIT